MPASVVSPNMEGTPVHTTASATASNGALLAANAGRRCALIQNDGSVDVYVKIGATAVANQGIRIPANGGALTISPALGNLSTLVVNGITASGSAVVLVTEWS